MLLDFRAGNQLYRPSGGFLLAFIALFDPRFKHFQALTTEMETQVRSKRPFCASCSKPACLCICSRFKTPSLNNSIPVTILQHSQEKNHPLNSTRIATLGLKNLTVATVSDIHFDTRFLIRLLKPDFGSASAAMEENKGQKTVFWPSLRNGRVGSAGHLKSSQENEKKSDLEQGQECPTMKITANATNVEFAQMLVSLTREDLVSEVQHEATSNGSKDKHGLNGLEIPANYPQKQSNFVSIPANHIMKAVFDQVRADPDEEECVISATMAKFGSTYSLSHLQCPQNHSGKSDFDQLLATQVGQDAVSKGFVVKKLQKKQLGESEGLREYEEFEIVVPPGSVLLFPTKKAIGIEAVDFRVNNLIVLDGTWKKAKRVYHENPWLKLLPHLKLDPEKMSLYGEVRHQPKAGCLSTIESIVYALKAFGDDSEELDDLLDVFESMIRDQRRCKDEKFSKLSLK